MSSSWFRSLEHFKGATRTLLYFESSYISLSDRYIGSIHRHLINNFIKKKLSLIFDAGERIELDVIRLEFRSLPDPVTQAM